MPGFHPLLWLLAVAVCISCAEGAPFSSIQKAGISINKLLQTNTHKSLSARDYGQQPSASYNKNHHISKRDEDNQNRKIVEERYGESIHQGARFENDFKNERKNTLKSKSDGASPVAEARDSGSGGLSRESREDEGIVSAGVESKSHEQGSGSSEESTEEKTNHNGTQSTELGLPTSQSEEECDDDKVNVPATSDTPAPTLQPTQTSKPTTENEDCEDYETSSTDPNESSASQTSSSQSTVTESSPSKEPTIHYESTTPDEECEDSSSSESSGSNSMEGTETPEPTDETEGVPTSPTTRPTRKRTTGDDSSLSFHASDSQGVEFSESQSAESSGTSTELRD